MTMVLSNGTMPLNLEAKTNFWICGSLFLGEYEISLEDCVIVIRFALKQAFLPDKRLTWRFWRYFQGLRIGNGYETIMRGKRIRTFRIHSKYDFLRQLISVVGEDLITIVMKGAVQIFVHNQLSSKDLPVTIAFRGIKIGNYHLSDADFLFLMDYVLTNENLAEDDPRRRFVKNVKRWKCFAKYAR